MLLQGPAGSGKTTFLEREAFRQASDGAVAIEGIKKREEFLPPPKWIPIYLRLRHRNRNVDSSERFLAYLLTNINSRGKFWTKRPSMSERLLEVKDLHWLLYLDGFDELTEKIQQKFVETISEFVERFPQIKVVLTSRPLTIAVDWGMVAGTRIEILRPLTDNEIRSFFIGYAGRYDSTPTASEVVALEEGRIEALRFIDSHSDIRRLCAFPSYLIATAREFFPSVNDAPSDQPSLRIIEQDMRMNDDWNDLSNDDGFVPIPLASDEFLLTEPISDNPSETQQFAPEYPSVEIRTGIVLKEIYQYLWERESERWGIDPIEFARRWESTGRLALITDGHQIIFTQSDAVKKLRSQTVLRWLLTLGILEPTTNLTLRFITELTKAFFAASVMVSLIEANDYRTAKRHLQTCSEGFCESMRTLLPSLTQRDFSQLF